MVLGLVFGPWALVLMPLVPVVGWARIRTGHHTLAQVVAGGAVGAVVAGVVFGGVMAVG